MPPSQLIPLFFLNFNFIFYILGLIVAFFIYRTHTNMEAPTKRLNRSFNWFVFLGVGIPGTYNFIMHFFFPYIASTSIGWKHNSFETEVAFANLGFGISGLFALTSTISYKRAVTIYISCFFLGAAINHTYEWLVFHNTAPANTGTILIGDYLLPIILWIFLFFHHKFERTQNPTHTKLLKS